MTHIILKNTYLIDALLIPIPQMRKQRHGTLPKAHNYQALLGYQPSSLLESKLLIQIKNEWEGQTQV